MKSEIPQLQVVTAISDSDCEDFVSQLLFSQGWSIIFRAIDMAGLMEFLEARNIKVTYQTLALTYSNQLQILKLKTFVLMR
jgi:hypothetical protein